MSNKLKLEVSDEKMDRFNISLPEKLIAALNEYHEYYEREVLRKPIPKNYFYQRVLQTAIEDDKDYQKALKRKASAPAAAERPAAKDAASSNGSKQAEAAAAQPAAFGAGREAGGSGVNSESTPS